MVDVRNKRPLPSCFTTKNFSNVFPTKDCSASNCRLGLLWKIKKWQLYLLHFTFKEAMSSLHGEQWCFGVWIHALWTMHLTELHCFVYLCVPADVVAIMIPSPFLTTLWKQSCTVLHKNSSYFTQHLESHHQEILQINTFSQNNRASTGFFSWWHEE